MSQSLRQEIALYRHFDQPRYSHFGPLLGIEAAGVPERPESPLFSHRPLGNGFVCQSSQWLLIHLESVVHECMQALGVAGIGEAEAISERGASIAMADLQTGAQANGQANGQANERVSRHALGGASIALEPVGWFHDRSQRHSGKFPAFTPRTPLSLVICGD